jgi:hypothetical protein
MDLEKKITESVLDRMIRAGWIEGYAHDKKGLLIEWTDAGTTAAGQFRSLFDQLGQEMSGPQLLALSMIIDRVSPARRNRENGETDHPTSKIV